MVSMIALIRVNNLADFNQYRDQVRATLEPFEWENSVPCGKSL